MKKILLLLSLFATVAFGAAGDRDSYNQNLGGNYSLCVNVSGTKRCPVVASGSDGVVTIGDASASGTDHTVRSGGQTSLRINTSASASTDVVLDLFPANSGGQGKVRSRAGTDSGATTTLEFIATQSNGTSAVTSRRPFGWSNGPTLIGFVSATNAWTFGASGGTENHAFNGNITPTGSVFVNAHSLFKNAFNLLSNGANLDLAVASNFGGILSVFSVATANGNFGTSSHWHVVSTNAGATTNIVQLGTTVTNSSGCSFATPTFAGTSTLRVTNNSGGNCNVSMTFSGNTQ